MTVEIWFNERGYHIQASLGEATFLYDLPDNIVNNASSLYSCRWMVLNKALSELDVLLGKEDKELILYTDSRVIEELMGEIAPDNNFAKSSLSFFLMNDSIKFSRIDYRKCSSESITSRLHVDGKSSAIKESTR